MNAQQLIARWQERDRRYANRHHGERAAPLTDGEVSSIRVSRMLEVEDLPEKDQATALAELMAWRPPVVNGY